MARQAERWLKLAAGALLLCLYPWAKQKVQIPSRQQSATYWRLPDDNTTSAVEYGVLGYFGKR